MTQSLSLAERVAALERELAEARERIRAYEEMAYTVNTELAEYKAAFQRATNVGYAHRMERERDEARAALAAEREISAGAWRRLNAQADGAQEIDTLRAALAAAQARIEQLTEALAFSEEDYANAARAAEKPKG